MTQHCRRCLKRGGAFLSPCDYRPWTRDQDHLAIDRPLAGFIIPLNQLRSFPVTEDLIAFSVRQRQFRERYERPPCAESVIGPRLQYSDWREDNRSSRAEHCLLCCPPLSKALCIQRFEQNV